MKQTRGIKTTTDCLTEISVNQQKSYQLPEVTLCYATRAKILFFLDLQSSRLVYFCCTEVVFSSPALEVQAAYLQLLTYRIIREVRSIFWEVNEGGILCEHVRDSK